MLSAGCGVRNSEEPVGFDVGVGSGTQGVVNSGSTSETSGANDNTDTNNNQSTVTSSPLAGSASVPDEMTGLWVETWDRGDYTYIESNGDETSYILSDDGDNCYWPSSLGIRWVHNDGTSFSKTFLNNTSAADEQVEIVLDANSMSIAYNEGLAAGFAFVYERASGITLTDLPICG